MAIEIDLKHKIIDFVGDDGSNKVSLSFREFWDLVEEFKWVVRRKG